MGVVLTAVDGRTNLWREVEATIAAALPGRSFATKISQAIEVAKCAGSGRTIFQMRQAHPVAAQYRALAAEVEWRALHREAFLAGQLAPAGEALQGE